MTISSKGRGVLSNHDSRFHSTSHETIDDGWGPNEASPDIITEVASVNSRSIISYNQSPDIPFSQSINPYLGCEHGCSYCYARPAHAWLGLSPGLDFETRLMVKENATELLEQALRTPGYRCSPIALGTSTDPYQPIERHYRLTRRILEILEHYNHPCLITTKSALIERDVDILKALAQKQLVQVSISITTLKSDLARKLEPRATAPHRRLQTIQVLHDAGIPVSVSVAPIIPVLTDSELETILKAAADNGVNGAQYVLLRLPLEVGELFAEWLTEHFPQQAAHVLSVMRQCRQGKINDARFGSRFRGEGVFADMIAQRFKLATRRLSLCQSTMAFNSEHFYQRPLQMELF